MIDFYQFLGIEPNLSVTAIQSELLRLEQTWRKREISRPDIAAEKLVAINQAKKVFSSDASKQKYDQELFEYQHPSQPAINQVDPYEEERKRQRECSDLKDRARTYLMEGQFDFALTALMNASIYVQKNVDHDYYDLLSWAYMENGDLYQALESANTAIMIESNIAIYHFHRGTILQQLYDTNKNDTGNLSRVLDYLEKSRSEFQAALDIDKRNNNTKGMACDYGALAESYVTFHNPNLTKAQKYLDQAFALGDNCKENYELMEYINEQSQYYQPYQGKNHPSTTSGRKGCYIATAVYGSYNCPQVWVLRRYRDQILDANILGKAFIRIYYRISPWIVRKFGNNTTFRCFLKKILDSKVQSLIVQGISDEKYYDN